MGHCSEIIFFLGAGASVDAGMPTVAQFTQSLKESLANLRDVDGIPRPQFKQFFDLVSEQDHTVEENYERFFEWVKLVLNVRREPYRELIDLRIPPGLLDVITSLPFVIGHEVISLLRSYQTSPAYLARLDEFLPESGRLKIFSLNYDCCVEDACHAAKIDLTTGFDPSTGGWNPSLFAKREQGINLYKLHGSLSWYQMYPYIEELSHGCSIFELSPEMVSERTKKPANDCYPELVLGPGDKKQSDDPFLTLLSKFHHSLYRADVCVVIGYGYRDDHINAMLSQALRAGLSIVNVSPSDSGRRFRSQERYDHLPSAAKEALEGQLLKGRLQGLQRERPA